VNEYIDKAWLFAPSRCGGGLFPAAVSGEVLLRPGAQQDGVAAARLGHHQLRQALGPRVHGQAVHLALQEPLLEEHQLPRARVRGLGRGLLPAEGPHHAVRVAHHQLTAAVPVCPGSSQGTQKTWPPTMIDTSERDIGFKIPLLPYVTSARNAYSPFAPAVFL